MTRPRERTQWESMCHKIQKSEYFDEFSPKICHFQLRKLSLHFNVFGNIASFGKLDDRTGPLGKQIQILRFVLKWCMKAFLIRESGPRIFMLTASILLLLTRKKKASKCVLCRVEHACLKTLECAFLPHSVCVCVRKCEYLPTDLRQADSSRDCSYRKRETRPWLRALQDGRHAHTLFGFINKMLTVSRAEQTT